MSGHPSTSGGDVVFEQYRRWREQAFDARTTPVGEKDAAGQDWRRCPVPTPGDHLGPLIVEEVVQVGKRKLLFRARNPEDLSERAVQGVLHWSSSKDDDLVQESVSLSHRLRHPFLVDVHSLVRLGPDWGGCLLEIREDLPPSMALSEDYGRRRAEPVPPSIAALIGSRIAEAVSTLHRRGLGHGRLSPRRVYCMADAVVKIDGVQASRTPAAESRPHPSLLMYRAPEVNDAVRAHATPSADIFALGALLFEFATGKLNFRTTDRSWDGLSRDVIDAPLWKRLEEVEDPALRQVLAGALQPEPERRYPNVSSMRASLDVIVRASYDVFISTRSRDQDVARQVFDHLTSHGLSVFLSSVSLPRLGDGEYRRAIDAALAGTRHMVVVASSPADLEGGWVNYEWTTFDLERLAERKQGNLVFVLLGDMKPAHLPIGVRRNEAIELQSANALERLLEYLPRG